MAASPDVRNFEIGLMKFKLVKLVQNGSKTKSHLQEIDKLTFE